MSNLNILRSCSLCPRNCGVDRTGGEIGFCSASDKIKVSKVSKHFWEEPCISGENGSGTVFFSNCNLKCVFCQNYKISTEGFGKEISIERLSSIFLEQQSRNVNNINLVTPTHYIPQIIEAIKLAKSKGLILPIVYNSNGYEDVNAIKMLNGYIDVYLPDLKYFSDKYAVKYSKAPHYFTVATNVIDEMFAQVGEPVFNENGLIKKGVIIRHLMLPGLLFDSKKIVDYVYKKYNDKVFLSLMNQYTPFYNCSEYEELTKPLNPKHYESLIDYCVDLGYKNAFIQEEGTCKESFIPDFNLDGV
ncbi:radical SAM protein [Clostridium sp. ATCC 25772]|uniref:radical SAM protein n=1 Tax=Clostridium sp. ATCC 25772 TaxID=1676991 RepID=UPI000783E6D9|nr:radical SAM protein [Clostridium sp. ATCC 25772]